ncbi:MAG: zinc ABC transporter substrate-binding protein [Lentisphaeria bacterium]|nr:zinc ABC transporter substrate-binding protein [Lentisphaeria bacterium]
MKKILIRFCFSILFLFPFFLSGAPGGKNILCTTFPIYLFTRNITKGIKDVKVSLLIPPGTGCPHDYTVTPGDMRKLAAKNMILVINGASLDDFFLKTVKKVNPNAVIIDSSREIDLSSAAPGDAHNHHHHHHTPSCNSCGTHGDDSSAGTKSGNPHLFASPFTARSVVKNIGEGLEDADPAHASFYHKNTAEYIEKLNKLCGEFSRLAKTFRIRKIVTQHSVFDYLAAHLHLQITGNINEGNENSLNARDMLRLIGKIKREKAGAIFTEPQYSSRTAQIIARECKIPFAELDPVANGPVNAPLDHYEKVMEKNLATMRKVLVP